ncbi:Olfactory receptor 5B12 [Myotis brandtii]|uniref:Olfactory receptor 5B12 n=2 Tax=Myotis brandtii TaxID=109478 RepID=S7QDG8_MYOBR|nr:Olfactory receptor 5B12 [Myotis brandtii]
MENNTEVREFILLGLTNAPELQVPLFIMFTLIYLNTVIGNLGIIMLILLDSRLHTPMYFFLCNLSLVDLCYSSTITPKVMAGFLTGDKVISYNACATQMFFFIVFATVENYLLASMAYDRYAAVCKPLHYTTTMTTVVCACMAIGCYTLGFLNASINVGDTFCLSFCLSNVIHHFFCDVPAVMILTCSDASHDVFRMTLMENISEVTEFILVGLTDTLEMQIPLFIIFSLIYLITLVGNLGMIMLIMLDSQLHTPMYFFLSNLSLVDCVYASAVTPKVIMGFLTGDKIISYNACASQMFFFAAFATTESFLLASMAFDRHVAVCKPLHYTTTMTNTVCVLLVTGPYICGLLESCIHVVFTFHLSFCHSNVVNHFFCDIPPLLALSCSDINTNETVLFTLAAFNVFFTLLVILNSYLFIFIAILRMHSTEGQKKAFSTCVSHLTTVSIFYGTIMFMYLQPNSSHSMDTDKMASIFYTMIIPMLNPLVYSLRNKEVKSAFKKVIGKAKSALGLAY